MNRACIRTDRRRFIGYAAAVLLGPSLAPAQPASRVMRVAFVPVNSWSLQTEDQRQKRRQANAGLFAEQGFVEGRNLALEYVDLDPSDAAEVERRMLAVIAGRPDAILVGGNYVDRFVRLTKRVPIVFYYMGYDPLRAGFVESYSRPGGNVTGIMFYPPGHEGKDWELLKEFAPNAKRVGLVSYEDDHAGPWAPELREGADAAATRLGLELVRIILPRNSAYSAIELAIRKARIDLLGGVPPDAPWIPDLLRFLERSRIPAVWNNAGTVRQGGLLSCHPSWEGQPEIAVRIVAQILRGASPATTPVQAPTRYTTAVNLRTARAMGLTVPPSILLSADVVVGE